MTDEQDEAVELVEAEAAGIDARSPDAQEQIQQLKDDAEELGLDVED